MRGGRSRARTRLQGIDVAALVADYEAGITVKAICESHGVGLSRLYRILNENRVPRRKPSPGRIPEVTNVATTNGAKVASWLKSAFGNCAII